MRPRNLVIALIAVAFVGAFYAFRPDRLFINRTVSESLPQAFAAGTSTLETGTFHTVVHPTQGDASIYRSADGARILRLTGFKTSNGPDVHIYMVAADNPSNNASVKNAASIDLGMMKGNVGDQNYALGPAVDLSRYRSVVVWCKRFSFNFGYAPLAPSPIARN